MASKIELEARVLELEQQLADRDSSDPLAKTVEHLEASLKKLENEREKLDQLLLDSKKDAVQANSRIDDLTQNVESLSRRAISLEEEKRGLQFQISEMNQGGNGDYAVINGKRRKILYKGVLKDVSENFRKNNFPWEKTSLILDRDGE